MLSCVFLFHSLYSSLWPISLTLSLYFFYSLSFNSSLIPFTLACCCRYFISLLFRFFLLFKFLTCDSCGTQTRRFCVHSACVAGSLNWFFSTVRYFNAGSFRSTIDSSLIFVNNSFYTVISSNMCVCI